MKNLSFLRRLRFAGAGIVGTFRSEASFRTQVYLAIAALMVLSGLRPPVVWLALCLICAGSVLALELINTSLERLADRLHPEEHESIRWAKDCAAGAVLLASGIAVIVGALTVSVSLGWLE